MLDYALLDALQAVAREGSFERAARSLHVTASAISQRIKLLEERLGTLLVVRGQPCTLTEPGTALCLHTEQVALLESDLRARLPLAARIGGGEAGAPTITIAANADSLATWLMPALAGFAADCGALVDLRIEDQDHSAELLRAGAVHGAVTTLADPVQGCRVQPLGRMAYNATASPGFMAHHFPQGVTRAALAGAPSLRFNRKDDLQRRYLVALLGEDVSVPTHWIPNSHAFFQAALGGMGWGMNPEAWVRPFIARGELAELVSDRPLVLNLYWQSWRLSSPLFDRLTAAIAAAAGAALN